MQSSTRVVIVPNPEMQTPHYEIVGVNRHAETYEVDASSEPTVAAQKVKPNTEQPAVQKPAVSNAPTARTPPEKKGFVEALFSRFAGLFSSSSKEESPKIKGRAHKRRSNRNSRSRNQRGQHAGNDQNANQTRRDKRDRRDDGNKVSRDQKCRKPQSKADKEPNRRSSAGEGYQQGREPRQEKQGKSNRDQHRRRRSNRDDSGQIHSQSERPNTDDDKTVDGKSGSAQRRGGEKRPRNTSQRKRGPRPQETTIETRPEEDVNTATAVGVSEQATNTQSAPASQHKVERATPEVSAGSNAAAVTNNSTDTANSASVVTIASLQTSLQRSMSRALQTGTPKVIAMRDQISLRRHPKRVPNRPNKQRYPQPKLNQQRQLMPKLRLNMSQEEVIRIRLHRQSKLLNQASLCLPQAVEHQMIPEK